MLHSLPHTPGPFYMLLYVFSLVSHLQPNLKINSLFYSFLIIPPVTNWESLPTYTKSGPKQRHDFRITRIILNLKSFHVYIYIYIYHIWA